MDYNATLTIHANKPATENDDIDDVMEAFAAYHPAVGDAPACPGALNVVITLPAHTLTQAVATAWVSVWAGRVMTTLRAPGHAGASPTAGW